MSALGSLPCGRRRGLCSCLKDGLILNMLGYQRLLLARGPIMGQSSESSWNAENAGESSALTLRIRTSCKPVDTVLRWALSVMKQQGGRQAGDDQRGPRHFSLHASRGLRPNSMPWRSRQLSLQRRSFLGYGGTFLQTDRSSFPVQETKGPPPGTAPLQPLYGHRPTQPDSR